MIYSRSKRKITKINKLSLGQLGARKAKQFKEYSQEDSLHYKHLELRLLNKALGRRF